MSPRSAPLARLVRVLSPALAGLVLAACGTGGEAVVPGDAGPAPEPRVTASSDPTLMPSPSPSPSATPSGSTTIEPARASAGDPAERVGIRMRVVDWSAIANTLESTTSVTLEDPGDELPLASKASAVSDLGHEQIPRLKNDKWPPDDQLVVITLSRAQWAFVLQEMRSWSEVSESMADTHPEMAEDAQSDRAVIALIERGLVKPARVSPGRKAPGTATKAGTRHVAESMDHQIWLAPFNAMPQWEEDWISNRLLGVSDGAVVVLTGVAWGKVELTVRALDRAPAPIEQSMAGWDVGEEETFEVVEPLHAFGPLGLWWAEDAYVPARPGLYRVRVLAHGRIPDEGHDETEGRTGERYEVSIWPVKTVEPRVREGSDELSYTYEPFSDHGDGSEDFDEM